MTLKELKEMTELKIPQVYDAAKDAYEVIQGRNGAARVEVSDPDGDPLDVLTITEFIAKVDITLSALRDAIRGTSSKTLTDLATALASIVTNTANIKIEAESVDLNMDGVEALLADILAKIIAAPSTEAKQDTIIGHVDGLEAALDTLNAKDFATQTTLAAILAKIIAAPSTEAKQDTIIGHVDGLEAAVDKVNVKDLVAVAPAVGVKTITATAAEIFAGASVKDSRRMMKIRNEDPVLRLRVGPSSVTQQNGYPIEPGGTLEILFDPTAQVAIYGISEGAAMSAAIVEV